MLYDMIPSTYARTQVSLNDSSLFLAHLLAVDICRRNGKSGKWKPWMGLTGNDNGKGKSLKGPAPNEDKGKKIAFAR